MGEIIAASAQGHSWMILLDSPRGNGFTNQFSGPYTLGSFSHIGWRLMQRFFTINENHLETRPFEWNRWSMYQWGFAQIVGIKTLNIQRWPSQTSWWFHSCWSSLSTCMVRIHQTCVFDCFCHSQNTPIRWVNMGYICFFWLSENRDTLVPPNSNGSWCFPIRQWSLGDILPSPQLCMVQNHCNQWIQCF